MVAPASKRLLTAVGLMASIAMLALATLSSVQQGRRSAKLQMMVVRPEGMRMVQPAGGQLELVPFQGQQLKFGDHLRNFIDNLKKKLNPPPAPSPSPPWNSNHYVQPQAPYVPPPEPPFIPEETVEKQLGFQAGTGYGEEPEVVMANPRSVYHNSLDGAGFLNEKKGDNKFHTTAPVDPNTVDPWVWSIGGGIYKAPGGTLYQRRY